MAQPDAGATAAMRSSFEKFIDTMNKDQAKDLARKINM